jgi:large subunit ribosomal protein L10
LTKSKGKVPEGVLMPKTKIQKQDLVQEMTDKLSKSHSLVFADYQGLTMTQLSALRDQLREVDAEMMVTKNNLLEIALKDAKFEIQDSKFLEGPVATVFAYDDEITPIKALVKALKEANIGKVKAGFLGTDYLADSRVNALAALPTKLELQAQVVGTLAAPLQGIVGVLNANLRNLAVVINMIKEQKGGE